MREALLAALGGISEDQFFRACGTAGGLLLAAGAQLPQIYHVTKRGKSRDISYMYQFIFAGGMVCFLIYYGYNDLWAVFIPSGLSLVCMCYLIGLKAYLEVMKPKRTVATQMINDLLRDDDGLDGLDGLDRPLLGGASEEKNEEDEFIAYTAPGK
ncbi:unnamed protein product [Ectocarpus sp. 13 AM-2016]